MGCEHGGAQVVSDTGSFTSNKLGLGEDAPSRILWANSRTFHDRVKGHFLCATLLISSMEHTLTPKMQVKNPSSKRLPFLDYGSKHTER